MTEIKNEDRHIILNQHLYFCKLMYGLLLLQLILSCPWEPTTATRIAQCGLSTRGVTMEGVVQGLFFKLHKALKH